MNKNLTLSLAVAAIASLNSLTLNAAVPALSPRGAENQIRTVPGVTENHLQHGLPNGSPKGRELQVRVSATASAPASPAYSISDAAASPRALATFPWLARLPGAEKAAPMLSHCRN